MKNEFGFHIEYIVMITIETGLFLFNKQMRSLDTHWNSSQCSRSISSRSVVSLLTRTFSSSLLI